MNQRDADTAALAVQKGLLDAKPVSCVDSPATDPDPEEAEGHL